MKKEKTSEDLLGMDEQFPTNQIEIINRNIATSDAKTIHDKLEKYESLDTEERRSIIRNIPLVIDELGQDRDLRLRKLFKSIEKDKDDIRGLLLQHLGEIAAQLEKEEGFVDNIKNMLIPILNGYLGVDVLETKEKAGKELAALALKLDDKDRGDYVLKHVIQMAHDDDVEENRIVAVQLFSSMSECFGANLCEQFITLQMLSLGEDVNLKVRKEAIKHLPVIAKLVSQRFFNRLFEFYMTKSKEANWAIRKTCADVLIRLSSLSSREQRERDLTDIMLLYLNDSNRVVRLTAYKILGPFIHQLKGLNMHPDLLKEYCRMAENDISGLGKDNELMVSCAFNFPAVLDALGEERWQPDLVKLYYKLIKTNDKRIKITFSESLHEVAKIIGEEKTEKYLFKVVDMFFKDRSDEIKLGVIRSMGELMQVFSQERRESLVGVFQELQMNQKKWRIRECICRQLGQLLSIYQPAVVFEYLVPLLLKFCSDSVQLIREEAAEKVADFIEKLKQQQGLMVGLVQSVKAFGSSPKYTQRQSFLVMCEKLMDKTELFKTHFFNILMGLANDKVINVRMILGQIVKRHIEKGGAMSQDEQFLKLRDKLKQDQEEEIREIFE